MFLWSFVYCVVNLTVWIRASLFRDGRQDSNVSFTPSTVSHQNLISFYSVIDVITQLVFADRDTEDSVSKTNLQTLITPKTNSHIQIRELTLVSWFFIIVFVTPGWAHKVTPCWEKKDRFFGERQPHTAGRAETRRPQE